MHFGSLEQARAAYAQKIRALTGLRSPALFRALGRVPREAFVGPGPWKIMFAAELARGYRDTSDPRELYDNVLIALDPERQLNNGEPACLLRWFDALDLTPGERFLHIGCGVGYYTAIAAEVVRPGGSVLGVELDPGLAERARRNTAAWPEIEVRNCDGGRLAGETFDAIVVNAGATEVLPAWLDLLRCGGRLLLPLTVAMDGMNAGVGWMLLVRRNDAGYTAEFTTPVGIYHCSGARNAAGEARLRARLGERLEGIRRLRRDAHRESTDCWLHGDGSCLSAAGS